MKTKIPEEKKYLWQLTIDEFRDLHQELNKGKTYEYGIQGIAKIFGCSKAKAYSIKSSGVIDDAISQNGKIIVIDVERALRLFANKNA
ncbi:DUF3853 family protein [Chryseobacterium taklimakanense]|uniref:DUF3853 family protein n=1 Tax=Chryseobacterium taklimakanense TaxID=536441 RepID=UPI0023F950AA|nr:DUF3853 family protein [Chryseobacterium taklimakanense]